MASFFRKEVLGLKYQIRKKWVDINRVFFDFQWPAFFFPVIIFALLDQDNLERFKEGVKAESGDDTRKLLYFERLIVCVCARNGSRFLRSSLFGYRVTKHIKISFCLIEFLPSDP